MTTTSVPDPEPLPGANETAAGFSANPSPSGPQHVAVVIPAYNNRSTIASTVRACRAIPSVDLIVVVDDGSTDDTIQIARAAGAAAVRHSIARGRASALETGVKVAAMRDRADWPSRLILVLDPDLGDSAVEATALVDAVTSGLADCAIGAPIADEKPKSSRNVVRSLAWKGIRRTTGWSVRHPLSTQRCLTREAVNAAMPFSTGWGVDVGITIDLLVKGFSTIEIPCGFHHLESSDDEPNSLEHYASSRYWDVWFAIQMRRLTRHRLPSQARLSLNQQRVGRAYRAQNPPEK